MISVVREDRGGVAAVVGVCLTLLLAVAALTIDLGQLRLDRTANQAAADTAALAAAASLDDSPKDACIAAAGYLAHNLDEPSLAAAPCVTMPASCTGAMPAHAVAATAGRFAVRILHPVPDSHQLMEPGAIGAPAQPVLSFDGDQCERVAVEVTETHNGVFSGVLGEDTSKTSVHAVAIRDGDGEVPSERLLNLVVLERRDCRALRVGGGGDEPSLVARAVVDPLGQLHPGVIAVDSDGTGDDCGSQGTIDVNGSSAAIRADGAAGCPEELSPLGTGLGCGGIEVVAPGPPGCTMPACSSTGSVDPDPVQVAGPLTRAPVDHRYNCKPAYPAALDIVGCDGVAPRPYIDELQAAVGPAGIPFGYQRYEDTYPCSVAPSSVVTVPQGNWVVGCSLDVKGTLTFVGGNVIFDDDVGLNSGGHLLVNTANTAALSWTPTVPYDITESSAGAAFVYLRNGSISKTGGASVTMMGTAVVMSESGSVDLSGGAGVLAWSAPTEGPFEDLSLWSDSAATHSFAGQATLNLEGIFFTPEATMRYTGSGGQDQVAAQFVTRFLHLQGNGSLVVAPMYQRALEFPTAFPEPTLIR